MRLKQILMFTAGAVMLSAVCACSDDKEEWPIADGAAPVLTMESTLLGSRLGSTFHIRGKVEDADGIQSISLRCPSLYLDKVIDIPAIYGEPLKSYDLDYKVAIDQSETGDLFNIVVTVTDVAGNTAAQTVTVDLDGDIDAPVIAPVPAEEIYVVLTDKATLDLNFSVTDDRELASVKVGVEGVYQKEVTDFPVAGRYDFAETISFPAAAGEYNLTVEAADTWGNATALSSVIKVTDTPDYPRMWLADVKTAAELTSDVMGVPMLIDRVAPFKYEARYYNEKSGTEIYFLPQRNDFQPVKFGLDPANAARLSGDASSARPIVLDREKVYYHFTLDILTKEYTVETYDVNEAVDPVPHPFGSELMDFHQDGSQFVEFWFGYMTDGPTQVKRFTQDPDNPHRYSLDEPLTLQAGRHSGFIIHNYHADGWWNYCTWRADSEQDPETVDYYGSYTNPLWQGKRGEDYWFKPAIPATGRYMLYFDAHLGRAKIIPADR